MTASRCANRYMHGPGLDYAHVEKAIGVWLTELTRMHDRILPEMEQVSTLVSSKFRTYSSTCNS